MSRKPKSIAARETDRLCADLFGPGGLVRGGEAPSEVEASMRRSLTRALAAQRRAVLKELRDCKVGCSTEDCVRLDDAIAAVRRVK